MREDEFYLDPTRITLVCGGAGFDGTEFKGLLANEYGIQVNKTSRNSVLIQSNINNTRSDVAHLIRVLVEICHGIENRLASGGEGAKEAFAARIKSLMTDVPDLPNFSRFHDTFRKQAGKSTPEGDIRAGFFGAYNAAGCEYVPLFAPSATGGCARGRTWCRPTSSSPTRRASRSWCRPGSDTGNDRLHAQARCERDPRLRRARGLKLLRPEMVAARRNRTRATH